jgi:hypothetical protein
MKENLIILTPQEYLERYDSANIQSKEELSKLIITIYKEQYEYTNGEELIFSKTINDKKEKVIKIWKR